MAEAAVRRTRSAWPGSRRPAAFHAWRHADARPVPAIGDSAPARSWSGAPIAPGSSRVDYGVGDYTHSIDLPDPTTEHVITLTDLITGTEVLYRVSTDGVELASGSFRTAAAPRSAFQLRRDRRQRHRIARSVRRGRSDGGARSAVRSAYRRCGLSRWASRRLRSVFLPALSGAGPARAHLSHAWAITIIILSAASLTSMRSICRTTIPPIPSATTRSIGATRISPRSTSTPGLMPEQTGMAEERSGCHGQAVEVCLLSSGHLQFRPARLRKLGRGQTRTARADL